MKKSDMVFIFIRSLTLQASFNFSRMQNLGFTFAILPLVRRLRGGRQANSELLVRHLQMFNTHPYLAAPVIGSVLSYEEAGDGAEAIHLKTALMGPYAGIGDAFFWGALRSFVSVSTVILAFTSGLLAPVAYLCIYNPPHLWVRGKGFLEGYRKGKRGIDFIRGLSLPGAAGRLRYATLMMIGVLAAFAVDAACPWSFMSEIPEKAAAIGMILLCYYGIRWGVSSITILYGVTFLSMVVSI